MTEFRRFNERIALIAVIITAVFLLDGCAAKKTLTESPETGINLTYKLPADPGLYYISKSDIKQEMDLQGQAINANIEQTLSFDLIPVAIKEGNLIFGITLDTVKMEVKSPMANFSAKTDKILGKSFNMELSNKGEELDLSEAKSLKYSIAQAGNRSIDMNFQAFFPDLPDQKIKIGDTWVEVDTITEESDSEEVLMVLKSSNTFEGVVTISGYECAKIVATLSGPRNGTQNAQGVTLESKGEVEGIMTWYFAIKEGIYVKSIMDSSSESMITASGAQNISFPMKMYVKSTVVVSQR